MRNLNAASLLALTNRMEKYRALSLDPKATRLGSSMYAVLCNGYKLLLQSARSESRQLCYEVQLMRELLYLQGKAKQLADMPRAVRESQVASYEYGVSSKLQLLG